jgi:hypothetical protein
LHYIFAVIVDAGPDIAMVFCGSVRDDLERGVREKLHILDVEAGHLRPGLFRDLADRLAVMAKKWRPLATAAFAPETLCASLAGLGLRAEPLPSDFKAEDLLAFASETIAAGLVHFCRPVTAKMNVQPIAAALSLRAGDEVEGVLRRR